MKQPKLQRNLIFALTLLLALATAIGFLYIRLPQTAASLADWDSEQITGCYVLNLRASGPSVDLSPEEKEELWALLEKTTVYWQGTSENITWNLNEGCYGLGIWKGERFQYVDFFGADQLTAGSWRYSGDTAAISAFLRDIWDAGQA